MLEKVISGFQTGVDIAAIHAARSWGLKTGGHMTKGFQTEIGSKPEYSWLFGAVELQTRDYPTRTRRNIEAADGTLIFTPPVLSPGTRLTLRLCAEAEPIKKNCAVGIRPLNRDWSMCVPDLSPEYVAGWIGRTGIGTLNVAGPRESKAPGIEEFAETYLNEVFRLLCKLPHGLKPGGFPVKP